MMFMKVDQKEVSLDIYTLIQDAERREEQHQQLKGQLYDKENLMYLRYKEELEGVGQVQNTLKIGEQQVKVIRSGAVKMNHLYQLGKRTEGVYHSPLGPLKMETKTTQLEFSPQGAGKTQFILSYELVLNEEPVGHFTLKIRLEE
jgi:uncharacterized beta-barrel protein YwiB (DUF1934 family)